MNAEQFLTKMNNLSAICPQITQFPDYDAIVQGLKEEIALKTQKSAGRASRFKAALRFSKRAKKEMADRMPGIAGAFIGENGAQYITNSHVAVRYKIPFEGLVNAEEGNHPNMDRILDVYDSSLPVTLPTLAELKTNLKLDKAEGKGHSHTEIDGVPFSTDYLIQLSEMDEPTEAYFSAKGKFPCLVVFGEGAQGIVCPVRITKGGQEI